jgi:hypothetical protein
MNAQNAEYVRIQWEAGPLVKDPDGWGCAGCRAVFPSRDAMIQHIREKQLVEKVRRLIDGRDDG